MTAWTGTQECHPEQPSSPRLPLLQQSHKRRVQIDATTAGTRCPRTIPWQKFSSARAPSTDRDRPLFHSSLYNLTKKRKSKIRVSDRKLNKVVIFRAYIRERFRRPSTQRSFY